MAHEPTEYQDRRSEVLGRLEGKTSKEQVNFRPADEEAETKLSCAECEHYLLPGRMHSNCRRVAGIVSAEDFCDLFVSRTVEGTDKSSTEISIDISMQ